MTDKTDAALQMNAVCLAFDGRPVLSDISFSVGAGEFVSVVGPSGCGKSSILRMAAGLQSPVSGTVHRSSRDLAYVFQDPTLMPWRTTEGNVALLAELTRVPAAQRQARVDGALRMVDLLEHRDKFPHQLSGGMRMRTSLARSLTLDPGLLLLDEPFGALDELSRERLNDELCTIVSLRGLSGLLVTHSVHEAVYLSDRILVMSPAPGAITAVIEVPLGKQRTPDMRFSPDFTDTCRLVHGALAAVRA